METIRGIVVEVTDETIMLLCPKKGTKHVIPRLPGHIPMIGQTATYRADGVLLSEKKRLWPRRMAGSLLAGSLFLLLLAAGWQTFFRDGGKTAQGTELFIALDINPSVEIYADENLSVKRLVPLTDESQRFMEKVDYRSRTVNAVIEQILDACVKEHIIRRGEREVIAISVAAPSPSLQETVQSQVRDFVERYLSSRLIKAELMVNPVSADVLQEARRLNVSVNKYAWYQRMKRSGMRIGIEDVRQRSMEELLALPQSGSQQIGQAPSRDSLTVTESGKPEDRGKPEDHGGLNRRETSSAPTQIEKHPKPNGQPEPDGSPPKTNHTAKQAQPKKPVPSSPQKTEKTIPSGETNGQKKEETKPQNPEKPQDPGHRENPEKPGQKMPGENIPGEKPELPDNKEEPQIPENPDDRPMEPAPEELPEMVKQGSIFPAPFIG